MTGLNTLRSISFLIEPGGEPRTVQVRRRNVLPDKLGAAPKKRRSPSAHLLIGFDTEYQTDDAAEAKSSIDDGSRNELLSYQFCVTVIRTADDAEETLQSKGIIIPDAHTRLSLEEFVHIAIGTYVTEHPAERVPLDVYLIGHFTRADLPAFSDFRDAARALLSNVRNTFMSLDAHVPVSIQHESGEPSLFRISIRDTIALAPANAKSLGELGKIVGLEKLVLHGDPDVETQIKSNMATLRREDWSLFRDYAIRDAEVCVRYAERIIRQYEALFEKLQMPATLTGFGTRLVIADWENRGLQKLPVLGREKVKDSSFNKRKGHYQVKTITPLIEELHYEEAFVTETYHGGRNEQFIFGPAEESDWRDHDLSSAYPTAMSLIGFPDWKSIAPVGSDSEVDALDLAFFAVDFEFPESVRFPVLPVRTANGIIFPKRGRSNCAAPEFALAKHLGAKLKVRRGIRVPTDREIPVFREFIRDTIKKRAQYPKGTFDNLFWKEVGNSTYGKTAQGLRKKRVYDLRDDTMVNLPESEITQPFFASFITSYTRAVLGEILNGFSTDVQVFSVTTDGFLSNASDEQISGATGGDLFRSFVQGKKQLDVDNSPLEIKHMVRRPIGWRTRGSATLMAGEGGAGIVLQKGGLKTNADFTTEQENSYTVRQFIDRTPTSTVSFKTGVPLKDMLRHDTDFVFRTATKYLSMEFDWKRRPIDARDTVFQFEGSEYRHLSFNTTAVEDVTEFDNTREAWLAFTKDRKSNLKSVDELVRFQTYCRTKIDQDRSVAVYMHKDDGALKRVRRDLCRAFKNNAGGFTSQNQEGVTAAEFAVALEACGIPCKKTDVENGRKAPFKPHQTVRSPEVENGLQLLRERYFTNLLIDEFLVVK